MAPQIDIEQASPATRRKSKAQGWLSCFNLGSFVVPKSVESEACGGSGLLEVSTAVVSEVPQQPKLQRKLRRANAMLSGEIERLEFLQRIDDKREYYRKVGANDAINHKLDEFAHLIE